MDDKELLEKFVGDDNKYGHGTATSSVIGMISDNGIGGAGVCQNVEIYPISYNADGIKDYYPGKEDFNSINDVLAYCIDNDIKILSFSIAYVEADRKLLDKFQEMGGVLIASAGNWQYDNDTRVPYIYPANYAKEYDNVISTAGSDDEKIWEYTCYGKTTVTFAAPGTNVLCACKDNTYNLAAGTSVSTPYVSGVIALLSSYYPNATMAQIKQAICETVDKKADMKGKMVYPGVINAKKALVRLQELLGCEVSEGEYYIRNKKTGKYLTCYGNGAGSNVNTVDFFNYESNDQKWKVEFTEDGNYIVFPSKNEEVCLQSYNNLSSVKGNNVLEEKFEESMSQKWSFEKAGENTFKMLSAQDSAYGISATNSATKGSEKVYNDTLALDNEADADEWVFEKIEDLYSEPCYFNVDSKYMTGGSSDVSASDFADSSSYKWNFKYRGQGYYSIHKDGDAWSCLQVPNGSSTAGTAVSLGGFQNNDDKQLWKINKLDNGKVSIESKMDSSLVLDLDATSDVVVDTYDADKESQKINLEQVDSIYSGTYAIRNASSNQYAKSYTDSDGAYIYYRDTCNDKYTRFLINYKGNGYYSFSPLTNTNLSLDVCYGVASDDKAIWQYHTNGTDAQTWKIMKQDDGTCVIASKLDENYVWNHNVEAEHDWDNNVFGIHSRDEDAISQEWYLESIDDTKDGYKIATSGTDFTGAELNYIGNNNYTIKQNGKYFRVSAPSKEQRAEYDAQGYYSESMMNVLADTTITFNNDTWFNIREINGNAYITPRKYIWSGVDHDGKTDFLSSGNAGQVWTFTK